LFTIAGNTAVRGTFFDWSDHVTEKFNMEAVPILKRSCLAENGDLHSFRLVMRGYDDRSNIMSDSAGPSELGNCSNIRSPIYDQPIAGRIYYDTDRVQGVRFFFDGTTSYF